MTSLKQQLLDVKGGRNFRERGGYQTVSGKKIKMHKLIRSGHLADLLKEDQEYLRRYCLKGQGEYEGLLLISRELRAKVRFECANLTQALPQIGEFDLIFLRNVLIYFDQAGKADIVRRVLTRLQPDGLLFTGHAESLGNLGLPLRTVGPAIHGHS